MALQGVTLFAAESHTGWWAGLIIGFAVVSLVVVLVGLILMYAARIVDQARTGIGAMDEARQATLPVWEIQQTNVNATRIWKAAERARHVLEEKLR